MPPSNQFPAPQNPQQPPQGSTPYDFFMDEGAKQRSGGGLNLSSGGMPSKNVFIIIGVVLGLAFVGIILAIIFGGHKKPIPLSSVVRAQQEIIVLSTDAIKNANTDTIKNTAITMNVTLFTAQQETITQTAKHGVKIGEKELGQMTNPKASQALAAAIPANTYDSTFTGIMQSEIDKYQAALNSALAVSASPNETALIKKLGASSLILERQLTEIK